MKANIYAVLADGGLIQCWAMHPQHPTLKALEASGKEIVQLCPCVDREPVATVFFTERGEVSFTGIYDRALRALRQVERSHLGVLSAALDLFVRPPVPHDVATLLARAESFISGFEDDPSQAGVNDLLADLRKAMAGQEGGNV